MGVRLNETYMIWLEDKKNKKLSDDTMSLRVV